MLETRDLIAQENTMNFQNAGRMLLAAVLVAVPAGAQTTAGQDMKGAGHDTKNAAVDTGHATKKVAKKTAHGTKVGAEKVGHGTKVGAEKVGHGTKKAAVATKNGTENLGDKIAGKPAIH